MFAAIDSWLFLLFLAAAAIFRLLTKAAGSRTGADEPGEGTFPKPDQSDQPARPESDEEQIRKFLEALGQPRTAKPPPPVSPRADVPPRPVAPVRPPRTIIPLPTRKTVTGKEQPPQQPTRRLTAPPPVPRRYEPQPTRPTIDPEPVFEVQQTTAPIVELAPLRKSPMEAATAQRSAADLQQPQESIVGLLRSANSVRQAVILREILGQPRGLLPLEDLPGTA